MKKLLPLILLFIILSWLPTLFAGIGKLDPTLGLLARNPEMVALYKTSGSRKSASGWQVDVIITFKGNAGQLRDAGARLICVYNDMAVATVPLHLLESIADLPEVIYVESSQAAQPLLDVSVPAVSVPQVRQQFQLMGKGVIIGIIDSGIDWTHESFRNPDGKTRIKYLLDLNQSGHVYGGRVYTEDEINSALLNMEQINETDVSGHGTHVAGIAVGDGSGSAELGQYAGVAPEADLIIIKATRDNEKGQFETRDQIIALAFIDSVASVLDKPYVANLSFGGNSGAHDGTSSVERFIDGLVGPGKAGKVVITVAGNDGDEDIHGRATLSRTEPFFDMTFQVEPYTPQNGSGNDQIIFDVWYDGSANVSVTLISPSGQSYGTCRVNNIVEKNTDEGSAYMWNSFYDTGQGYKPGVNPFNGDREIYIMISDAVETAAPAEGEWTLRFTGNSGTVDAYLVKATMDVRFVNGNMQTGKISIPGTAKNSITVGAFITKKVWVDMDGNRLTFSNNSRLIGELASFSSPGPTRDGRVKPEITAPGQMIVSARSKDASASSLQSIYYSGSNDYPNAFIMAGGEYGIANGTSFAAPHVAGVVALILQKYPDATALQIREMLINSARVDSRVGSVPNDEWGWGKLDALSAINLKPDEEPPMTYDLIRAYPNPFASITRIQFDLPLVSNAQHTTIKIYNSLGQQVRLLLSESLSAGRHSVYWDGRDDYGYPLATGIYFVKMDSDDFHAIQKIALLGAGK